MTTQPRGVRVLGGRRWLRGLAAAGVACAIGHGPALAQQPKILPAAAQPKPAATTSDYDKRVVAYVHGNVPVTREELGEFLIARGGMEKVELLVNRKIIEIEAHRRNVSATPLEVGVGLDEDLRGVGAKREEFIKLILPKFGKTLYEWEQDVIRPRILLGKMCRDRVKVTEDELRRLYENRYGEKRQAQIVAWPKNLPTTPEKAKVRELTPQEKSAARSSPEEFDRFAAAQPNVELARVNGRTNPVGRYGDDADPKVEAALFSLKVGEISDWIETPTSWLCMKLLAVTPPDANNPIEKVRGELEKELVDKKINAEIPKFVEELKKAANPVLTVHVPVPPAPAVPAGQEAPTPPVRVPESDARVLARVYGTLPVTREDLGEFLMARGGYEKLELLVNKKVIDLEAAKRGLAVTPQEVETTLKAFVSGLPPRNDGMPLTIDDFVKHILPEYKKSLYEYNEDVIKPRLLLEKMCRDRVRVTADDLRMAFENKFGEKRGAKIILWPNQQLRLAQKQWDECRRGQTPEERDANFDRIAREQDTRELAAHAGAVLPVGRFADAENPVVERALFSLQEGEISELLQTPAGIMCVKCVRIFPPTPNATIEAVRPALEKEVYEKKLAKEVPAFFGELKKQANPNILLKGPPTDRENAEGVRHLIQQLESLSPKR